MNLIFLNFLQEASFNIVAFDNCKYKNTFQSRIHWTKGIFWSTNIRGYTFSLHCTCTGLLASCPDLRNVQYCPLTLRIIFHFAPSSSWSGARVREHTTVRNVEYMNCVIQEMLTCLRQELLEKIITVYIYCKNPHTNLRLTF